MKYEEMCLCKLTSMLGCSIDLMNTFWHTVIGFDKIDSHAYEILREMYRLDDEIHDMFKKLEEFEEEDDE